MLPLPHLPGVNTVKRSGQMVQIREDILLLDDGRKRNIYLLQINLGKGRKRAREIRARLETALRAILPPQPE